MADRRVGGFKKDQDDEKVPALGYLNISLKTTKGEKRLGKYGFALAGDDAYCQALVKAIKAGQIKPEDLINKLEVVFVEATEKADPDDIEII